MAIDEILTYQIALAYLHSTKLKRNWKTTDNKRQIAALSDLCIILQRTSTNNTKPKVAESEIIGTNHLGFAKSLFQQYSQQLDLNDNHYPAESAFNFYINERITDFLERPNKSKEKLQTPAVTPKGIQIPNWKKQRIESLIYPSYYYMSGSTINITSADASTSTKTPLARIAFQIIVIDQPPIELISEPIQPPQVPPQQLLSLQQPLQQPPQPPNLDPMVYTPIAKLDNFTGKEDNAQSLINKPQDFEAFKEEFLRYFSNNNSINCLVNTFTTIKQGETEAVTTYLRCFHRNLRQIQAIDANYFTVPQILNQFICGLCSSILQHVHLLHPGTLQDAVTYARDFEFTESKANYAQVINLVMNGSSELDSKLEKFSELINKRLEGYLADNHAIYQSSQ
ncbi:hypothetical protein G9A89_021586 [Geosiphon pyriformis]|nr:hypothetical protein G9A89_021586 [Geosiphon pyriformis]